MSPDRMVPDERSYLLGKRERPATPAENKDYARARRANGADIARDHDDDRHREDDDEPIAGEAWPDPIAEASFHGIAGRIVRMIEPHTEADPAALLVQFIVAAGAYIGRGPHVVADGAAHHANLFALVVGDSSKARKGTAWRRIEAIISRCHAPVPVLDGLSSGEGIKYAVRDPVSKSDKDGKIELVDDGANDKRALVVESEFASVLAAMERNGNTLSPALRGLWDSGSCRTLTKHDPITVTDAHVAIIGHITTDELRRKLTTTEMANGLANRILFVCARRSKLLPLGGGAMDSAELMRIVDFIEAAASIARTRDVVPLDDGARTMWCAEYEDLSAARFGLLGAITARAEAQVIRLALVYALLDRSATIGVDHLRAASALWSYSDASAKFIFGTATGDAAADTILRSLRSAGASGMTRNEIRDIFARNLSSAQVSQALDLLRRASLARCDRRETGGRPAEVWRAI